MAQELWQIAKPFGRPPKFKTPEELWGAFLRYVEWSTNNPMTVGESRLQRNKAKKVRNAKEMDEENYRQQYKHTMERPLSLVAFRLHAGIKRDWDTFKKEYASRKNADFCGVLQAIEETVRQQQVENAMVGNYKENIVSRINNISDTIKQEVTAKASVKGMTVSEAKAFLDTLESEI